MRQVHFFTPEQDEQLRRVYNGGRFNQGVLRVLAPQWGVRDWVPSYRAQKLGLSRVRESSGTLWKPEELRILESNAHLTAHVVARKLRAKGFRRSPNAVVIKRRQMQWSDAGLGYSAHELGQCLGLTSGTICAWIRRGLLEAKPRIDSTAAGNGEHPSLISSEAVKRFIVEHTSLVRIGRVDKYWFVDLLTNKSADREGRSV